MKWNSEQVHRYARHHYLLGMWYFLCSQLTSFGSSTCDNAFADNKKLRMP